MATHDNPEKEKTPFDVRVEAPEITQDDQTIIRLVLGVFGPGKYGFRPGADAPAEELVVIHDGKTITITDPEPAAPNPSN